jgi:hypothetical protein
MRAKCAVAGMETLIRGSAHNIPLLICDYYWLCILSLRSIIVYNYCYNIGRNGKRQLINEC